jgi:hypothetical protein
MNSYEKLSPPNIAYREHITASEEWAETPSAVENALAGLRQIDDPRKRIATAIILKSALSDEIEAIKSSNIE